MKSYRENIMQAISDFDGMREAITQNGVEVPYDTNTSEYGELVNQVAKLQYDEGKAYAISEVDGMLGGSGTIEERIDELREKADERDLWVKITESISDASSYFEDAEIKTLPFTNFINATTALAFCSYSTVESIDYYLNTQLATIFTRAFQETPNLRKMVGINMQRATIALKMFDNSAIEEIEEPFNFSSSTNMSTAFSTAYKLKEIRFVPSIIGRNITFGSAVLSDESVQSIIDGLMAANSERKLTLETEIVERLTEEQLQQIADKKWAVG